MTKKTIQSILKPFLKNDLKIDWDVLDTLTTNLQGASKNQIVFYRIGNDKAELKFKERLADSTPGLLIMTGVECKDITNSIHVNEQDFEGVQKSLSNLLYPLSDDLKIVGVTGTNGKTSVVHISREIAAASGKKSASIGTLGIIDSEDGLLMDLGSTSPSYVDLRRVLNTLEKKDIEVVFIEISSHALEQKRFGDGEIKLDAAGWTNFTQDHLDYHGDMESYFEAKSKILNLLAKDGKLFIHSENVDLNNKLKKNKNVESIVASLEKSLPTGFKSGFQKLNLEMSLSLLNKVFPSLDLQFDKVSAPVGRFSVLKFKQITVVIDYAHTPDALENVCKEIVEEYSGRFTVVMGCGGDRDAKKRPLMGKIANKYADHVIITNDNPRTESSEKIASEIKSGISGNVEIILDRKEAILSGLKNESKVVLIAGKGHETYQETNGVKKPFSDFQVVNDYMDGHDD
ncbi:MAG: UDP-N-acetylmuramoyl-L-alanyl-D-glutamate--2,6-diaminopimelate ligase [Bacteriovoracaceae bacterium]|nr:UDP-N-acetylmuramoyl-L-alanyl-D-glutamate--2,6-diaminopimelate ligase [Bacteriovoracaceae bacterium]